LKIIKGKFGGWSGKIHRAEIEFIEDFKLERASASKSWQHARSGNAR
jgi:hypothetical protein